MILDFSSQSKSFQHSTIALCSISSLTCSCSSICLSSSAIVSSTYLTSLSCSSKINEPLIYACLILSLFAC